MLLAAGLAVFLAAFGSYPANSGAQMRRTALKVALLAVPLLLGHYAMEAARIADDWSGMVDSSLQRLVMNSPSIETLALRLIGLTTIAFAVTGTEVRNRVVPLTALGTLLIAGSFVLVGHTVTHALRPALAPLLIAHVTIVAFWLGALLPLHLACAAQSPAQAGQLVRTFSRAAAWIVPLIAVAGAGLALALVRDLGTFSEPYGKLLLAKAAGFCLLMCLAAFNRWRLGPALLAGEAAAARLLRRSLVAECLLIVAVIAVTSVMTSWFSPER